MPSNRYAILIASSEFCDKTLNTLRCPPNDVERFAELLESSDYGKFTEVMRSVNESSNEVLKKIQMILQKTTKDDLIVIYYSGHGKPQKWTGSLHLATVDTEVECLDSTSIPMRRIKDLITDVGHTDKVAIILDCCYSGAAGMVFKSAVVEDQIQKMGAKSPEGRGIYILSSSTENQVSKEKAEDKYGIYTKYIIRGIENWGAINENGDVTLNTLHKYVADHMAGEGIQQNPMKSSLLEVGDIVLASKGVGKREERVKGIRVMLLELGKIGFLSNEIISKGLDLLSRDSDQLTGEEKELELLLNDIYEKRIEPYEFIHKWYKFEREWANYRSLVTTGTELGFQRKFEEALGCFNKAIALRPNDPEAWANKGDLFCHQGKYNEADECYNKVLNLDPRYVAIWIGKGNIFSYQGNYDKAIEYYDKALDLDPKNPTTWNNKGIVFRIQGDSDKAIECIDKALDLDPKYAPAWANKGDVFYSLGNYDRAIECLDKALALDLKDPGTWSDKGRIFCIRGNYNKAIECLDKALDLDPKHAPAWRSKGDVAYSLGNYNKAIEYYDKALALDPKDPGTWSDKGHILCIQGNYNKAIECLDKALDLDPKNPSAWNNKGCALFEQGNYDKAIECLDKALDLDPKNTTIWNNKGNAFRIQGNYDKAIGYYYKALALDPKIPTIWNNMGHALEKMCRYAEAKYYYDRANKIKYYSYQHNVTPSLSCVRCPNTASKRGWVLSQLSDA